jgi:hypothetical protein
VSSSALNIAHDSRLSDDVLLVSTLAVDPAARAAVAHRVGSGRL